jgi:hypothetical protein
VKTNIPGVRRARAKKDVRDYLLIHGPSSLLIISRGTHLTPPAVSRALRDIRNDPAYEYATVATKTGGYLYRIAVTVAETKAGIINQLKHDLTRAESLITAGQKLTKLAVTTDDFAIAADLTASGKVMKSQAESVLSVLQQASPPAAAAVSGP